MSFLMLYGNGWAQRWQVPPGKEAQVRSLISRVGTDTTGRVPVLDPGSDAETTLVVSWALVAAAVLLDSTSSSEPHEYDSSGQYA